jgi:hypothetical protein
MSTTFLEDSSWYRYHYGPMQYGDIYESTYSYSYETETSRTIASLKKALKDKHLNPALKVQYAKELQKLL